MPDSQTTKSSTHPVSPPVTPKWQALIVKASEPGVARAEIIDKLAKAQVEFVRGLQAHRRGAPDSDIKLAAFTDFLYKTFRKIEDKGQKKDFMGAIASITGAKTLVNRVVASMQAATMVFDEGSLCEHLSAKQDQDVNNYDPILKLTAAEAEIILQNETGFTFPDGFKLTPELLLDYLHLESPKSPKSAKIPEGKIFYVTPGELIKAMRRAGHDITTKPQDIDCTIGTQSKMCTIGDLYPQAEHSSAQTDYAYQRFTISIAQEYVLGSDVILDERGARDDFSGTKGDLRRACGQGFVRTLLATRDDIRTGRRKDDVYSQLHTQMGKVCAQMSAEIEGVERKPFLEICNLRKKATELVGKKSMKDVIGPLISSTFEILADVLIAPLNSVLGMEVKAEIRHERLKAAKALHLQCRVEFKAGFKSKVDDISDGIDSINARISHLCGRITGNAAADLDGPAGGMAAGH